MHSDNWDDLRFVLAVAEHGSLSAAARELGVNHATVLRRVKTFEERVGGPVFLRTSTGYEVRTDRLRMIEAAREVAHSVQMTFRLGAGETARPEGHVKVTSTDSLCLHLLPPVLSDIRAAAPELRITLLASNQHLNLSRNEAEITVRPALGLPEGLVGEAAGQMRCAVYMPRGAANPDTLPWIGASGPISRAPASQHMQARLGRSTYPIATDSFAAAAACVASGLGQSILPCLVAEGDPRLERRRGGPVSDVHVPIWVGCHSELSDTPRLTTIRAALVEAIARRQHLLDPDLPDAEERAAE